MPPTKNAPKKSKPHRGKHIVDATTLRAAMTRRLQRRLVATGNITVPAVPGARDHYLNMCRSTFAGLGRPFDAEQLEHARRILGDKLTEAYRASPRSNTVISFNAPIGSSLNYEVASEIWTIAGAYDHWVATRTPPLFGTHPDARVMTLAAEIADPKSASTLDIGAGTGRNALALARLGCRVDALEMTPNFADLLEQEAAQANLDLRIIRKNLFESAADLGRAYHLILLSEVLSDFKDTTELRRLFEIANETLVSGGKLVFNVHVPMQGYVPEPAILEWAQNCYSMYFTYEELALATQGLSLELVADDSVYDFEKAHLPAEAWPPTGWYEEWVSGQDLFDVERHASPIEMRWLVYRKT